MSFKFPFKPYATQEVVMDFLYNSIIKQQNCVIESPTGTGKSLMIKTVLERYLKGEEAKQVVKKDEKIPNWLFTQALESLVQKENDSKQEIQSFFHEMQHATYFPPNSAINWIQQFCSANVLSDSTQTILQQLLKQEYKNQGKQVVYATRTHSQLAQFNANLCGFVTTTLAARESYCVNETADIEDIDNFCKNNSCIYRSNDKLIELFSKSLGKNLNKDELKQLGEKVSACPYYVSQMLKQISEVTLITHQQVQETGNENAILVIDEAHNLPDQITLKYTSDISVLDLLIFVQYTDEYLANHRQFIKVEHSRALETIKQTIFFALKLIQDLVSHEVKSVANQQFGELLKKFRLSQMLLQQLDIVRENRFVHRIRQKLNEKLFYGVLNFLTLLNDVAILDSFILTLRNDQKDPLHEYTQITGKSEYEHPFFKTFSLILQQQIKLIHLNPIFSMQYKSIACLGGTLQPFAGFMRYFNLDFETLSVGHVIQPHQLKCNIVTSLGNCALRFTSDNQQNEAIYLKFIQNLVLIRNQFKPNENLIVFVPSYAVLKTLKQYLLQNELFVENNNSSSINANNENKIILTFEQPKTPLQVYTNAIQQISNHILIGVASGSLAEGIDFKDDLCRCLIILGIPFPNVTDPFIIEKQKTDPNYALSRAFKSVNQAVGRAIRWVGDWAQVYLVDSRYVSYKDWISQWVRDCGIKEIGWL